MCTAQADTVFYIVCKSCKVTTFIYVYELKRDTFPICLCVYANWYFILQSAGVRLRAHLHKTIQSRLRTLQYHLLRERSKSGPETLHMFSWKRKTQLEGHLKSRFVHHISYASRSLHYMRRHRSLWNFAQKYVSTPLATLSNRPSSGLSSSVRL